ncbi:hypothetical protein AAVH_02557 [Aphelenchoides avenae]|nr:hypothetical protein AAVH_02557 [Aphelenchus avenae]
MLLVFAVTLLTEAQEGQLGMRGQQQRSRERGFDMREQEPFDVDIRRVQLPEGFRPMLPPYPPLFG